MENKNDIYSAMEHDVSDSDLSEEQKKRFFKNILQLKNQEINLMITGATGCGKSSTINALFDTEVAKVGVGVDPETMDISRYGLKNLILWDSPGLGDGKEADTRHAKNITQKLHERDKNGKALIDLVLVILDGGSRDLGTSYELINSVIIPNLGKEREGRILVAINQCDIAMKGKYWNDIENKPELPLIKFLDEKVASVKRRIKEGTGVDTTPIYYSAGYKEGDQKQNPYNLSKLFYYIVTNTPTEKRLGYIENLNKSCEVWSDNDELKDYQTEIKKSFAQTVCEYAADGAEIGGNIGKIFGKTGEFIGKTVGAVAGAVVGAIKSFFSFW